MAHLVQKAEAFPAFRGLWRAGVFGRRFVTWRAANWRLVGGLTRQAVISSGIAFACAYVGILPEMQEKPDPSGFGFPLCLAGSKDAWTLVTSGMSMGLVMLLVSLAPLRWRGIWSGGGLFAVVLWISIAGAMNGAIMAADLAVSQMSFAGSALLLRLSCLMFGLATALLFGCGRATDKIDMCAIFGAAGGRLHCVSAPLIDGGACLARCAPMVALMPSASATSAAWMVAGSLLGEIVEIIDDVAKRRLLTLGVWGVGIIVQVFGS